RRLRLVTTHLTLNNQYGTIREHRGEFGDETIDIVEAIGRVGEHHIEMLTRSPVEIGAGFHLVDMHLGVSNDLRVIGHVLHSKLAGINQVDFLRTAAGGFEAEGAGAGEEIEYVGAFKTPAHSERRK